MLDCLGVHFWTFENYINFDCLILPCSENDGESPRDVMLDLSASQKSSGFEFDENEDKTQNKPEEDQVKTKSGANCHQIHNS